MRQQDQRWTGFLVTIGLAGMLSACAQTPSVPTEFKIVPNAKGGPDTTSCSRPVYPPQALADKIEGTSTIGFLIGPDGRVRATRLYTSSGDASLDDAARVGLTKCRFKPATSKGEPVEAWLPVQYVWTVN